MATRIVVCGTCATSWPLFGGDSVYERQAVESRPCPRCASYTLRLPEQDTTPKTRRSRMTARRPATPVRAAA